MDAKWLHKIKNGIVWLAFCSPKPFLAQEENGQIGITNLNWTSWKVLWKTELDGKVQYRNYSNKIGDGSNLEPDIGISENPNRAIPVSMVSTVKSIYLFDGDGNIKEKIPLRWDNPPRFVEKGDTLKFVREFPVTDPKGRFFLIRTMTTTGWDGWTAIKIRGYNLDGSLRFELTNQQKGNQFFPIGNDFNLAPSGEFITIFYSGKGEHPGPYLSFYDTSAGTLTRHFELGDFNDYDIDPMSLYFSVDGNYVFLKGNEIDWFFEIKRSRILMTFDGEGDIIQMSETNLRREASLFNTKKVRRENVYNQLLLTESENSPSGLGDILIFNSSKMGVYTSENTLSLFEW